MKYENANMEIVLINQEVFMALSNGGVGEGDSLSWGDFFTKP